MLLGLAVLVQARSSDGRALPFGVMLVIAHPYSQAAFFYHTRRLPTIGDAHCVLGPYSYGLISEPYSRMRKKAKTLSGLNRVVMKSQLCKNA